MDRQLKLLENCKSLNLIIRNKKTIKFISSRYKMGAGQLGLGIGRFLVWVAQDGPG